MNENNNDSNEFNPLIIFQNKRSRPIIAGVIILVILVVVIIKMLSIDSVVLLNEVITNGRDPQLNNGKNSIKIKPSLEGVVLPKKSNTQWWKYIVSPNVWFNNLNKKSILLTKKNEKIEFTYNIWIKIFNAEENLDWQQSFEKPKILLNRQYSPILLYVPKDNTFRVGMQTDIDTKITFYEIPNFFKLQTWENLCVVLQERNLDIFLNGKLKISFVLPTIPYLNNEPIQLFPNYGFYAQVCLITYFPRSLNLDEIQKVYEQNKDDKIPFKRNFKKILN